MSRRILSALSIAAVVLLAFACGAPDHHDTAGGVVAQPVEDDPCEGIAAGWPANRDEIIEGLGADTFARRQCASKRLADRICSSVPADLKAILEDLAANSPDAEIRYRASDLLTRFSDPPSAILDLTMEGATTVNVSAGAARFTTCDLRVYDTIGGAPAEPVYFAALTPSVPEFDLDPCGRGVNLHDGEFTCTPGRTYVGVIDCSSGDGRTASATDTITCPMPPPTPPPSPSPTPTMPPPTPPPSPSPTPTMPPPTPPPSPSPTPTMPPPTPPASPSPTP